MSMSPLSVDDSPTDVGLTVESTLRTRRDSLKLAKTIVTPSSISELSALSSHSSHSASISSLPSPSMVDDKPNNFETSIHFLPHPYATTNTNMGNTQNHASANPHSSIGEPEWEWSFDGSRAYFKYWYKAATSFLRHKFNPTRIRSEWNEHNSHVLLQIVYTAITFILFFLLFYFNGFAGSVSSGYGSPQELTCHSTGWGRCGINGGDCQPFESDKWEALRCPHRCKLLKTEETVIGGDRDTIYKADSRICNAAIHAGIIDDSRGGCFLYRPSGVQSFFQGGSTRNGITSLPFESWFPGSFQLTDVESTHCHNFGIAIICVAIGWFIPLALIKPHGMLIWYILLFFGYWYIALSLSDRDTQVNLFWTGTLNSFIVGMFGYVLYHTAPKHALYVPSDYDEQSRNEFPWRLCCRLLPGPHRRIHQRTLSQRRSHTIHVQQPPPPPSTGQSLDHPMSQQSIESVSNRMLNIQVTHSEPPMTPVTQLTNAEVMSATRLHTIPDVTPMDTDASPMPTQHEWDLPLIPSSGYSPSPSPSPNPCASPESTSLFYHPPIQTFPAIGDDINEVRRRPGKSTEEDSLPDANHQVASAKSLSPSDKSLVIRPWYDLYFLYIIPFLLALHFSYLIYIPGITDIDLSSEFFSHGAGGIILIAVIMVIVLAVVIHHMKLAFRINLLFRYILYYFYAVCIIIFVTLLFASTASFHLHHVLAGLALIPITRFNSRISLIFQAVMAGIFLNGLAMWNFTVSWDIVSPNLYSGNHANIAGPLFPLTNVTTSSVTFAWAAYTNKSDAIGATFYLNDIEILHSTYTDTSYGGRTAPSTASFEIETDKGKMTAEELVILVDEQSPTEVKPTATTTDTGTEADPGAAGVSDGQSQSTSEDASSSPSATGSSSGPPSTIDRQDPSEPIPIPTPASKFRANVVLKNIPHPTATQIGSDRHSFVQLTLPQHEHIRAPSIGTKFHSKQLTFPFDPVTLSHPSYSSLSSSRSSHSSRQFDVLRSPMLVPSANSDRKFFVFQLNNLLPNTSYLAKAGYILPNGYYSVSRPIIFTTKPTKP